MFSTDSLVSVIIPVYNAAPYLKQCLSSVITQSYKNIEIICVDDCSTDESIRIIDSIRDERFVVIKHENNLGVMAAREKAYSIAKGEFIAHMDADDVCAVDRIEKQVRFFDRNPNIQILGTAIRIIDEKGNFIGSWSPPCNDLEIKAAMLFESALANPTVMFRREVILENGWYDRDYLSVEDYEMFTRMACGNYRFANLTSRLLNYRIVNTGMTLTHAKNTEFRDDVHARLHQRNFDALAAQGLNISLHRQLVQGEITDYSQLTKLRNYLMSLTVNERLINNYSSRKALEKKASDLWVYCCLRASNNVIISPLYLLSGSVFRLSFYSVFNGVKAVIRSVIKYAK